MNSKVVVVIAVVALVLLGLFIAKEARDFITRRPATLGALATPTPPGVSVVATPTPSTQSTVVVTPTPSSQSTIIVTPTTAGQKEFTVTAQNYTFDPGVITVNRGDKVKINLNVAEGSHNLTIDQYNLSTPITRAGQSSTINFTADKTGQFTIYCSVPGHRERGMIGALIVM